MKKWRVIWVVMIGIAVVVLMGTVRQKEVAHFMPPVPVTFVIPKGFPSATKVFDKNSLTREGIALGRRLFYDGRLSKDGNFSCASCHQQFAAFSTYDHAFSHGFDNSFTTRNAPGLFNLAWQECFHWDGGVNHLEVQPLSPITASNEMAEELGNVLAKLRLDSQYRTQFRAAFGDETINTQRLLKALAQFVGTIISADSKYDRVLRGETTFNEIEQSGYQIYKTSCAGCHPEPLFTDFSFRNNGFKAGYPLDSGRMRVTNNPADSLKFKVPTLRNLLLTAPYMHDGRLANLQQVVDHYNSGIIQSSTLDPLLKKGIILTKRQKGDLIIFLSDLTDYSFIKDPQYSMPQ